MLKALEAAASAATCADCAQAAMPSAALFAPCCCTSTASVKPVTIQGVHSRRPLFSPAIPGVGKGNILATVQAGSCFCCNLHTYRHEKEDCTNQACAHAATASKSAFAMKLRHDGSCLCARSAAFPVVQLCLMSCGSMDLQSICYGSQAEGSHDHRR